jgi:hypothetical protein
VCDLLHCPDEYLFINKTVELQKFVWVRWMCVGVGVGVHTRIDGFSDLARSGGCHLCVQSDQPTSVRTRMVVAETRCLHVYSPYASL